ncbi:MAG: hypothetical protein H5T84_11350, partial [Thermoleophilia bacterium]|nr:hypothetical protein [Thermoleophilia bacterium]
MDSNKVCFECYPCQAMEQTYTVTEKIARIDPTRAAARLEDDLRVYADLAVQLGMSEARVIDTAQIVVDERVALKCSVPKCFGYGTCANCPPHAPTPEEIRRIVNQYRRAVVMRLDVRPEAIVRDRATIEERVQAYQNVFRV